MTARFLGALAVAVVALALPGLAAERAIDTAPSHYATVDGANGLRVHYKSFGSGDTALVRRYQNLLAMASDPLHDCLSP